MAVIALVVVNLDIHTAIAQARAGNNVTGVVITIHFMNFISAAALRLNNTFRQGLVIGVVIATALHALRGIAGRTEIMLDPVITAIRAMALFAVYGTLFLGQLAINIGPLSTLSAIFARCRSGGLSVRIVRLTSAATLTAVVAVAIPVIVTRVEKWSMTMLTTVNTRYSHIIRTACRERRRGQQTEAHDQGHSQSEQLFA